MERVQLLIDGVWTGGTGGRQMEVTNPADEEPVAVAEVASDRDVSSAVEAAHRAFLAWSQTGAPTRIALLRKAASLARERLEDIARQLTLEQGKPLSEARGEIKASIDALEYYSEEVRRACGRIIPNDNQARRSLVIYQPVGPVAAIGPWNYPVLLLSWKMAPAIAAGCTLVVKPSSVTPVAVSHFIRCLVDAGAPPGVINMIVGPGNAVGDELVEHPLIRKIAFTGSSATGRSLMRKAAGGLKRLSLELGGQCPMVVFSDAAIGAAAKGAATRSFRNMGQVCNSIQRIYVEESAYDAFLEAFVGETRRFRIGRGTDDPDLGPMTTKDGLDKTVSHVEDARGRGAKVTYGGKRPEDLGSERGYFYMPTILENVDRSMRVMQEESFGPVVTVTPFNSVEEAVELANDTAYGLVAYLFTGRLKTAFEVAERIQAGTVSVNNVAGGEVPFPYGGWKDSGFGLELSHEGLNEYLLTKHIRLELS